MNKLDEYLYAASVVGLFQRYSDLGGGFGNQDETEGFIYDCLGIDQPVDGIDRVLDRMATDGLVNVVDDEVAGKFYQFISNEIARKHHEFRESPGTVGGRMAAVGLKLFHTALINAEKVPNDLEFKGADQLAPASDRLVMFDDNTAGTEEVVELTEAADEAIRGSNSLDDEQRGWIREHLKAGIEFIKKHKKMLAAAASALLLKPLLAAYEAVAEEPAKIAIMAAIEAVKLLFGI